MKTVAKELLKAMNEKQLYDREVVFRLWICRENEILNAPFDSVLGDFKSLDMVLYLLDNGETDKAAELVRSIQAHIAKRYEEENNEFIENDLSK